MKRICWSILRWENEFPAWNFRHACAESRALQQFDRAEALRWYVRRRFKLTAESRAGRAGGRSAWQLCEAASSAAIRTVRCCQLTSSISEHTLCTFIPLRPGTKGVASRNESAKRHQLIPCLGPSTSIRVEGATTLQDWTYQKFLIQFYY